VLREEERLEAVLLDQPGDRRRIGRVVGGKTAIPKRIASIVLARRIADCAQATTSAGDGPATAAPAYDAAMRSLRAYFLRHAESVSNADAGVVALPPEKGDRLSELGQEQARRAASHLADAVGGGALDRILASPLHRARETADVVSEELGLPVETLDSMTELRESEGYGELSAEEQRLHRWSVWMAEHGHDPDYSYRGGESFNDLLGRVRETKAALEAMAERPGGKDGAGPHVLAVSHGIFLRFFLLDCLLGEDFRASHVPRLWQVRTVNCGMSLFEYHAPDRGEEEAEKDPSPDPWRCITWMARPWDPP